MRRILKTYARRQEATMVQVWGIGERKFGGDFSRRMLMFNVLVKSVIMYAVEIWYKRMKEIEALQERYLKGILGEAQSMYLERDHYF